MLSKLSSPISPRVTPKAGASQPARLPELPQDRLEAGQSSTPSLAKWALAGVGALSVFAPAAQAAPQAQIHKHSRRADVEFQRLVKAYHEVEAEMAAEKAADAAIPRIAPEPNATYVLPGSARVDLYKPVGVTPFNTEMGVNLGHGLVLDGNGTLSLLTQSGSELTDFQQLERTDGGYLTSHVKRDGNTYRSETPDGKRLNIEDKDGGATIRSGQAFFAISGGTGGPSTFINGRQGTQQQAFRIDWKGNEATIKLPNQKEVKVTIGLDKAIVEDGSSRKEYAITPRHVIPQDAQITVDQQFRVSKDNKQLEAFKAKLDAVEPGFVKSHPVTMALVEHTMQNADFADLLKTQKELKLFEVAVPAASAVTGVQVGLALTQQAQALSLGAKAMALKGTALGIAKEAYAAKAGAEAAMAAGNLPQAVSLGQKAQTLAGQAQAVGGQAKSLGGQAVHIGEKAKHAAHVAKTASIVGGSMAIVDGLITGYHGFKEIEAVEGAMKVVSAKLQQVAEEENSQTFEVAKKDYEQVTPILLKLAQHAHTTVTIGGVKVGCGALTLGSAFMSGPVAPIVAGAVGSACYLGTAIYDHYRQ
ncbi:hypothetical protein IV102_31830 [bacterium]|nr:hypothetical protein [bacterium]